MATRENLAITTTTITTIDAHANPGHASPTASTPEPLTTDSGPENEIKKKQKRNKPTLSCVECVERKTKCDRARPSCLACVKRQSVCRYSEIANLIAASGTSRSGLKSKQKGKNVYVSSPTTSVDIFGLPTPRSFVRSVSANSSHASPSLLSNIPHTKPNTGYHVFGVGSQHPFANYWTTQGGIPEVIGVLPTKEQADTLVAKFFESVDPVYPMLHKEAFYMDYDEFWALSHEDKLRSDPSLLALQFAIYAMGAQFLAFETDAAKQQISEFYISAAHQSLRLYPFLSKTSLRSIEAMVLMAYFLMNDNKTTDAWAFAGILVKQAYAMGLHRDPEIIVPQASAQEKNQRRKVWQAVFHQDTFITVLVKLPPTTTFSDVSIDSLTEDKIEPEREASMIANPMSISSIAPRQMTPPVPPPPHTSETTKTDTVFIRSMWHLAELVQRTVCQPRALTQPLTTSTRQKAALINSFRNLYSSFPQPLSNPNKSFFASLVRNSPRVARQALFLRSNYWHCMMLIQADTNEEAGVKCDIQGALESGRLALGSFFDFWTGLRNDASVWWTFQHRAFEEALIMSTILSTYIPSNAIAIHASGMIDPFYVSAKNDIKRTLDILENVGSAAPEMKKTRTDVLRAAYESIRW